ncbi:MAG: ABC transporter ATP-binding protein [Peptococcaceae bacterium]|nr:ABC transporter ATP-binding protein [Peptococcaceae bacterium]
MVERECLLELENVSYAYQEGRKALEEVSARFYPGERVAVLGNNGAGKSTFFLCCNGVLRPEAGRLLFEGREIRHKRQELILLRKNVGIVFQEPDQQIIAATVESEVSFGPMNLKLPKEEVLARVEGAIKAMDLEEYRRRPPHYLSGGEKKRVSIADILAMEPKIILFDEPTASLDPQNSALLEKTLDELSARGMTLVVSTHDVDFAWRFARRLLVFHQGKIIADGLPEEIFADDELICRAGLKKPLLYQAAAELLSRTGKEAGEKAGKAGEEDRSGKTGETRKTGGPGSAGRSAGKLPPDLPKTPEEFRHFLEKRIR